MRAATLAFLLLSVPAFAGTQVGIVYNNTTGEIMSITIPDNDKELDDPAYQRKGGTQLRISVDQFMKLTPKTIQTLVPIPLKPSVRVPSPESLVSVPK